MSTEKPGPRQNCGEMQGRQQKKNAFSQLGLRPFSSHAGLLFSASPTVTWSPLLLPSPSRARAERSLWTLGVAHKRHKLGWSCRGRVRRGLSVASLAVACAEVQVSQLRQHRSSWCSWLRRLWRGERDQGVTRAASRGNCSLALPPRQAEGLLHSAGWERVLV